MNKEYNIFEYLRINGDNEWNIQAILEFVIFWNFIEREVTKLWYLSQYDVIYKYLEINKSKPWFSQKIDLIYCHFKDRYTNNSNFNFDSLCYEDSKKRHLDNKDLLNKVELNIKEKIELISYIISRFRNRLFHWHKFIQSEQEKNFIIINNFLYFLNKGD